MHYGVSYYPEHKNAEELRHDLRLIVESGVNTVRLGEFAWSRMEPSEGVYDFSWLEAVVDYLGEHGIRSILCTPTACPPAWMVEKDPGLLYVDNRRVTRPFGGRRLYCYNHEGYRKACAGITHALGRHFGKNPHVLGWQIDNELAQEGTGRCCCPVCTRQFQAWLKEKYGTVDALNRQYGTVFWSQEYTGFQQILPPVNTIEPGAQQAIFAYYENPSLRLDFERFSSDSQIDFQNIQADILRGYTKSIVTTNATGLATNSIDYYKSSRNLDNYAFDFYPSLRDSRVGSFPYAFARGVKQGQDFWVLEFMSGGGHRLGGSGRLQPNPGALMQAVVQAFAHGADAMLHFQFRTFPYGAEQLNYAIVDMDGVPRRRYREMQETAAVMKRLSPLKKAEFPKEAAILVDYDCHWAHKIKPANDQALEYFAFAEQQYKALADIGVNADVVSIHDDWRAYRLVVLPALIITSEETQRKIADYARQGGVVVASFLLSVKNEHNAGHTASLPAGLTGVFGVAVEELEPVFAHSTANLDLMAKGRRFTTPDGMWSELLGGEAEPRGVYSDSYKKGQCVVSKNRYGKGLAWYIGTNLSGEAWRALYEEAAEEAGIRPLRLEAPPMVEIIRRKFEGRDCLFLLNFDKEAHSLALPAPMADYLSGERQSAVTLPAKGFLVLLAD